MLAALHPFEGQEKLNRLDLALWLIDRENPLTARVAVNRIWQEYFGLGIVETENDFGTQGSPPTHPKLLDWLAVEFMERGWSRKAIHRLILNSAVYRQSSHTRPELEERDPRNRLLARQNRLRLDAEIVRDVGLSVSGLLTPTIGGPGVYPPQPETAMLASQLKKTWEPSEGEGRYRRGMYTFFWRVHAASGINGLRSSGFQHCLHQAYTLEHAVAGADAAQRRGFPRVLSGLCPPAARAPARRPHRASLRIYGLAPAGRS